MSIKGRTFTGKLSNALSSLRDSFLFATLAKVGSGRVALDTTTRKFAQLSTGNLAEIGSTDILLKKTAHGLKEGYQIRITASANGILEEEVFVNEVIDANTVQLSGVLSASLAAGDTFDIYKPVSERVGLDGSSMASITSTPQQILVNGVAQTVQDSSTPANVVAIPVKIMAAGGTNVNITAGDINIQTSAEGVNFDSQRIGDGTGKYAGITAANEIKSHDADVLAALMSIDFATFDGQNLIVDEINLMSNTLASRPLKFKLDGVTTDVSKDTVTPANSRPLPVEIVSGGGSGQATEAKQDTQITAANLTNTKLDTVIAKDFATSAAQGTTNTKLDTLIGKDYSTAAKQDALATLIGAVNETAPALDTDPSGLNGGLKRLAQRFTTLLGRLPASLGQKASAASLSVVISSDQTALPMAAAAQVPTYAQATNIDQATVVTLNAPANAKGCKVMAGDNSVILRFTLDGTTPTASIGFRLDPGRSEDFTGVGALKVIAETAATNQSIFVHWSV